MTRCPMPFYFARIAPPPDATTYGCNQVKRREFITLLGGTAVTWPLAASAQQPDRVRRIGVLMSTVAEDAQSQLRLAAFVQGLQQLGWIVGRNVQIDTRWGASEAARHYIAELLELSPDVIVVGGRAASAVEAVQRTGRIVPIVFVQAVDPVGAGYVATLARPGGNATGFTQLEYTLSAKWLQLLKEVAPGVTRAAVLREPGGAGIGQWAVIQAAAQSVGAELSLVDTRDPVAIERGVAAFAREPNGGLIIAVSSSATTHRELIVALAARYRLPAVYPYRYYVAGGGLMSYGPDLADQYRLAAGYVDRILKGAKPADLPVQAPTKYELAINLKTAKALGLEVPPSLLVRADEVIE
jgi:putative ABC transport system substrate-binding protein